MNVFAVLNLTKKIDAKNLTVRWLIENRTLLGEKNLFSLLRVYELVMLLSRLHKIIDRCGVLGFLPHLTQSPSPPPKITFSAKGKEHRTLTHPLCYEVLET